MKVRELQEMLEGYDPDEEILVAIQPSYPIAVELVGVTDSAQIAQSVGVEDALIPGEPINVWLVTGSSPYDKPYAPRACWEGV